MKNKLGIIIIASALTLLCAYFLSFTLISNSVQSDAEAFATDNSGKIDYNKKQAYLDSLWNKPAFDFLGLTYTFKQIKENELHLGLDLQGGMHVVVEVSPIEIVRVMAGNYVDKNFELALSKAAEAAKTDNTKFSRLFYNAYKELDPEVQLNKVFGNSMNKTRITVNSTNEQVLAVIDSEIEDAITRSFNILRTRIDKFGVTQPNIQRLKGTGRIQLELPGVNKPERVRKLLQGTAKLEFLEVYEGDKFGPYFEALNKFLLKQETKGIFYYDGRPDSSGSKGVASSGDNDTTKSESSNALFSDAGALTNPTISAPGAVSKDSIKLATSKTTNEVATQDSVSKKQSKSIAKMFVPMYNGLGANVVDTAKVNRLFNQKELKSLLPDNMRILWAVKPVKADDGQEFLALYFIKKGRGEKAALEGDVIVDARMDFSQDGQPEVLMQMNANGAKKWRKVTGQNIGRRVAIVLDNYVYSAPVVQGEIPNGSSSISGNFEIEEAKDLANVLKAGKLPAPVRIVEEAVVGPSLGQESIDQGLNSSLIGLIAVIIFMIFYYSSSGIVANIGLFVNLFFLVGVMSQMQAVMTLPGIAGIVLTMGMAVDANVLINERIREELRSGRSLLQAISIGYSKANSSIVDGNVTTFLVGAILAAYGSGPVQGFAVTLMIGIITSFFTSVFITRFLFDYWANSKFAGMIKFSIPMTEKILLDTNYDVVGSRKIGYIISTTIIAIGFGCIVMNGGLSLGVDFKGGRSYIVQFKESVSSADVRSQVVDDFKNAGTEVKTFGSNDKLKITTSYLSEDESEAADNTVQAALSNGLKAFKDKNPEIISTSKVGATIADDIKMTSLVSMLLSLGGIFIYIFIRFQWFTYSLGAIIALFHDVLMAIALTGILASFGIVYEIDQVYIAAILTVIGYSINDTVVVFDRLREFLKDNPKGDTASVINLAINRTFSRTVITAMTVFLVVLVLYIFGGEVLRGFSFVLLVGVTMGTYSSIFIASPIVMDLGFLTRKKTKEHVHEAKVVKA
ncbi:MAG: protein translocase subunit SecDF [Bacteroidota bacterium]|nr:protein translocase subunit SecDF [Bacteroidota bacterium]